MVWRLALAYRAFRHISGIARISALAFWLRADAGRRARARALGMDGSEHIKARRYHHLETLNNRLKRKARIIRRCASWLSRASKDSATWL